MRWRGLTLRGTFVAAAAVAVAVGIGASVGYAYITIRHELIGNVDRTLKSQAATVSRFAASGRPAPPPGRFNRPVRRFGDQETYLQVIKPDGTTQQVTGQQVKLPVTAAARSVADGSRQSAYEDIRLGPTDVRMLTTRSGSGITIQIALPLTSVNSELSRLGWEFAAAGLGGIILAGGLGWVAARAALSPIGRLTAAAERVATTQDLAHRITDRRFRLGRRDELTRLATSFNAMLEAVQRATLARRQLVADASHELRTPLTAVRTNVEVLARGGGGLTETERDQVFSSVLHGLDELTALVSDTVELARGEEREADITDLEWDTVVKREVERAQRHWPEVVYETDLQQAPIRGVPSRIERAVANLLDNAAKFSSPGGTVEVVLRDHELTIRDHGIGIDPQDLPHIFDRFYRARAARGRPGSGLGLAIVQQITESHGGRISAEAAPGGGTLIRMSLPGGDRP